MKLHNRIMSWILSPGAYAVWHALGVREEWTHDGDDELVHKATGVRLFVLNWRNAPDVPVVFAFVVVFFVGGFIFDCKGEGHRGAIGYLERHIVAIRAYWVVRWLHLRDHGSARKKANMAVFTKLTVNE